jgi:hypothetical protein
VQLSSFIKNISVVYGFFFYTQLQQHPEMPVNTAFQEMQLLSASFHPDKSTAVFFMIKWNSSLKMLCFVLHNPQH